MSNFGSLPEPWLSNGPSSVTDTGPEAAAPAKLPSSLSATCSLPDLGVLPSENVCLSSWLTSVEELAWSLSSPPPHAATANAKTATAVTSSINGRRRWDIMSNESPVTRAARRASCKDGRAGRSSLALGNGDLAKCMFSLHWPPRGPGGHGDGPGGPRARARQRREGQRPPRQAR